MDNITKEIEIDLYSPAIHTIRAQQGDNNARLVRFSLFSQGVPYRIPDNVVIKTEGHRGDGSSFIKENCTVSDNAITIALDNDILYADGMAETKIIMYDLSSDRILSTIPFRIHVQKNPCDKNRIESEKRSVIDWLVLSIEKLKVMFETHRDDTVSHLSMAEHERFNRLTNEVITGTNENVPDYLQEGDCYLQEYE